MPNLAAAGVSISVLESLPLIWKTMRFRTRGALPIPGAVQIVETVAPDDGVDADGRPVAEHGIELLRRLGGRLFSHPRETEIVFVAAEIAELVQPVQHDVDRRRVGHPAPFVAGRPRPPNARRFRPVRGGRPAGAVRASKPGKRLQGARPLRIPGTAVEKIEFDGRGGRRGYCAARLTSAVLKMPSAASSLWPTISKLLPLCGRNTTAVGSLIATASPSQAWAATGGLPGTARGEQSLQRFVPFGIGRNVSFEHDLFARRYARLLDELVDLFAE